VVEVVVVLVVVEVVVDGSAVVEVVEVVQLTFCHKTHGSAVVLQPHGVLTVVQNAGLSPGGILGGSQSQQAASEPVPKQVFPMFSQ
jgi:hypothetical protein